MHFVVEEHMMDECSVSSRPRFETCITHNDPAMCILYEYNLNKDRKTSLKAKHKLTIDFDSQV